MNKTAEPHLDEAAESDGVVPLLLGDVAVQDGRVRGDASGHLAAVWAAQRHLRAAERADRRVLPEVTAEEGKRVDGVIIVIITRTMLFRLFPRRFQGIIGRVPWNFSLKPAFSAVFPGELSRWATIDNSGIFGQSGDSHIVKHVNIAAYTDGFAVQLSTLQECARKSTSMSRQHRVRQVKKKHCMERTWQVNNVLFLGKQPFHYSRRTRDVSALTTTPSAGSSWRAAPCRRRWRPDSTRPRAGTPVDRPACWPGRSSTASAPSCLDNGRIHVLNIDACTNEPYLT